MLITYRRKGGVFTLLVFMALAAVTVALTVTIGAIVLMGVVAVAVVAAVGRALLPASWRRRRAGPAPVALSRDVIEGTIVVPAAGLTSAEAPSPSPIRTIENP